MLIVQVLNKHVQDYTCACKVCLNSYVHAIIVRLHLELPWIYYVHAMKLGHDLIRYLCSHEVVLDAVLLHFTCFTLIIKISEYLPQETKFRLSTMVWNINCEGGRIGLQAMEYKCNGEWEGEGEREREWFGYQSLYPLNTLPFLELFHHSKSHTCRDQTLH